MEGGTRHAFADKRRKTVEIRQFGGGTCGDLWNATPCRANEAANWTGFSPGRVVFARPMFARRFRSSRFSLPIRWNSSLLLFRETSFRDEGKLLHFPLRACLAWRISRTIPTLPSPCCWYARYLFARVSFFFLLTVLVVCSRAIASLFADRGNFEILVGEDWRGDLLSRLRIVYSGKILRLVIKFFITEYIVFLFI